MKQLLCLSSLILLLAAVCINGVQSETRIEVDENGDEYEVKRFHIQGRQLNGGRSQCVITRRKRASASASSAAAAAALNIATAAAGEDVDNDDDDNYEVNDSDNEGNGNFRKPFSANQANDAKNHANDADDNKYGKQMAASINDNDTEYVLKPVIKYKYNDKMKVSRPLAHYQQGMGVTSAAAAVNSNSDGNVIAGNSIVLVQSHKPPRVNPNTHAVFELLPVPVDETETSYFYDNAEPDNVDSNDHYSFTTSTLPTATTAIWSTGSDNQLLDNLYNDQGGKPLIVEPIRTTKKPTKKLNNRSKKQKKRRRQRKQPTRKSSPASASSSSDKRKQNQVSSIQQIQRKTTEASAIKRKSQARPRPQREDYDKKQSLQHQAHKRHNKNKQDKIDQGTRTFTKSFTVTRTGTVNNQPDVNCIFINKDPPTTQRPFWSILGRNGSHSKTAQNSNRAQFEEKQWHDNEGKQMERSRKYGQRKRVNLRIFA